MKMNVCVVTGSRAEFGLLNPVMNEIKNSKKLKLSIVVAGTHLSRKFGNSIKEIEANGFKINEKVFCFKDGDQDDEIINSFSKTCNDFGKKFKKIKPNIIILLGDRYEILAASIAAMISRIPIGHIHGGEITQGAIDDSIRHSITKMSHLHFVAHKNYRKRVIQLGESPKRVFNVGGLGAENISKINFLSKNQLQKLLKIKFLKKNFLITYHPVTLEPKKAKKNISEIINSLREIKDTLFIFTIPNSDNENSFIFKKLEIFSKKNKNVKIFKNLGTKKYLSLMRLSDVIIGNSSSGILETPSFKKPCINIGIRQKGRIQSNNIINVNEKKKEIAKAIKLSNSLAYQKKLKKVFNPFKKKDTSKMIVKILENQNFKNLLIKKFYDFK